MDEHPSKNYLKTFVESLKRIDRSVESQIDMSLMKILDLLRYLFIAVMILYVAVCIMSLSHKIFSFTLDQGALDFASIKIILTDGLFTLIVIAIVKTFFIRNGLDYAITLLEIGFVVIIRKLILLETVPEEAELMTVLGITSAVFFLLIIFVNTMKNRWKREAQQASWQEVPKENR